MNELLYAVFESSPCPATRVQAETMARFHAILTEANKTMNLTAITGDKDAAVKHYLDSAAPLFHGYLPDSSLCCDVGSGAGFPGLVLAILRPDCRFVLLDSLLKRVGFLNRAIEALSLPNAEALHCRAEEAGQQPLHRERYDVVLSRAVAALPVLCEYCLPLVRTGGNMIAYKGPEAAQEAEEADHAIQTLGGALSDVVDSKIPDVNHHLIRIAKIALTPKAYPRRAGLPEKKPL